MPSGKTHSKLNLAVAVAGGIAFGYATSPVGGGILAASAIASDLFLSPDLDQEVSDAMRRWGSLRPIWWWYKKLAHRSPLSHWPGLADAIRLAYLGLILSGLWLVIGSFAEGFTAALLDLFRAGKWGSEIIISRPDIGLPIFAGLSLATAQHCLADLITSEAKGAIKDWAPKTKRRKK